MLDRLTAGLAADLTLVSAPAGYGKTTLVAAWIHSLAHEASQPHALSWLAVQESDNSLDSFVHALTLALRREFPNAFPRTLALLTQPAPVAQDCLVQQLLTECAALERPVIQVIDDLHLITDATVHKMLLRMVRQLSDSMHLVLVSRCDPPWGVARLRADGRIAELRAQDLQFTREEAATLFELLGAPANAAALELVHRRTEGWAAGLRMAIAGLQAHEHPDAFLRAFEKSGSRYLVDYLADEVLEPQPAEVQRFLLLTAILERFSAPLCAAVIGDGNEGECHRIIDYLVERNLFIVPLDSQGEWYRLHAEFRSLLLIRGRFSPAVHSEAHLRAAQWLLQAGFHEQALSHLRVVRNFDPIVEVLEAWLPQAFNEGRWVELDAWLMHLPAAVLLRRPLLLLAQAARCVTLYRIPAIPPLIAQVDSLLSENIGVETPVKRTAALGLLEALRCTAEVSGAPTPEVYEHAECALRLLPPEYEWPLGYAYLGIATHQIRQGQYEEASRVIQRELGRLLPRQVTLRRRLMYVLTYIQLAAGSIDEIEPHARRFLEVAERAGCEPDLSLARYSLAWALYEREDFLLAGSYLDAVLDPNTPVIHSVLFLKSAALRIAIDIVLGTTERAWTLAGDLRRRMTAGEFDGLHDQVEALLALVGALNGEIASARAWAHRGGLGPADAFADVESLVRAHILIDEGSERALKEAHTMLVAYVKRHKETNYVAFHIRGGLLLARVLWGQHKKARALEVLEEVVQLAHARGYHMCLMEVGPGMGEMLHELATLGRSRDEAGALLAQMSSMQIGQPRPTAPLPDPRKMPIEALTDREMEILRALGRRLSNKEIARDLGLSAYTVRFHASNVYAKLNVGTRAQAVERATVMGLLPPAKQDGPDSPVRARSASPSISSTTTRH